MGDTRRVFLVAPFALFLPLASDFGAIVIRREPQIKTAL